MFSPSRIAGRAAGVLAALLLASAGCNTISEPEPDGLAAERIAPDGAERTVIVRTPFRARAYTDLAGLAPDPSCGDPPRFLNTQVGEGTATHLGRFTVVITFCVDASDLLDDGQLSEGESLPYDTGFGTLVAANGDELYLEISGAVLPSDHPDYDFEFHDAFSFAGGSGRLAGATGGGTTASFVDQSANRTDHDWRGTLVLSW